MERATPRLANCASLVACTLVSLALVATTASVVLPRPTPPGPGPLIICSLLSANSRPPAVLRAPATIFPVAGSRTSPTVINGPGGRVAVEWRAHVLISAVTGTIRSVQFTGDEGGEKLS